VVKPTFLNLPEDKRQRIIDVAVEEFAGKPYSKASLSNIVSRAGIAKGSMYQYFEDKKDLYSYLLDMAVEEKMAYIKEGMEPAGDFFASLEQAVYASTRFSLDHPKLGQVLANAMDPMGEEVLQEFFSQSKQTAMDWFENMIVLGQQEGTVRRGFNTRLMAHLLYSTIGFGLMEYFLEAQNVNMHEFITNPQLAKGFTEDAIRDTVREIMDFVRGGLEAKGWGK